MERFIIKPGGQSPWCIFPKRQRILIFRIRFILVRVRGAVASLRSHTNASS